MTTVTETTYIHTGTSTYMIHVAQMAYVIIIIFYCLGIFKVQFFHYVFISC